MSDSGGPLVSVVLPCLNEEQTVGKCVRESLEAFDRASVSGEVIVIDNGSTDGSAEVAKKAGARTIHEPLRGKGFAVRTGIEAAEGQIIVLADSDGTYDLSNLEEFIRPLQDQSMMVVGNRLKGRIEPGAMPWLHRHVGNPFFSGLISLITRQRFGDCLSGLRSFRRDDWNTIRPTAGGFEIESEMSLRAGRRRLPIREVPVDYSRRRVSSKLRALTHGWAIAKFILLDSADLIFFLPAFFFFVLGIISLAVGAATTTGVDVGTTRWQPVFAGGILIPGAVALFNLGIAAKWLAWRRGIVEMGRTVAFISKERAFDITLIAGLTVLIVGLGLDGYLLWRWGNNSPPPLPLGLGAIAQALVVSGLNLVVTAFLVGALKAASEEQ